MKYITIILSFITFSLFSQVESDVIDSVLSAYDITFNESRYDLKDSNDYANKVYINPLNGESLADVVTWVSNTAYLSYTGTIDTLTTKINIDVDNVMLGTYGGSTPAIIRVDTTNLPTADKGGYKDFYDRFRLSGDSITVRDLEIIARTDIFGDHCTLYNNNHNGDSLVGDLIVVWGDSTKLIKSYIHESVFEGIYCNSNNATYGAGVDIGYSYIVDINKSWYVGATQAQSDGDGIQMTGYTDINIFQSVIDKSSTGNKFSIILNNENAKQTLIVARVDSNVVILPKPTSEGGGGIYFGAPHQSFIKGNRIYQPDLTDSYITAIWLSASVDSATISGNLIVDPYRDLQIAYGERVKWFNNTSVGYTVSAANNVTLLKENNIAETSMSGSTNTSLADYTASELFTDADNGDYSLAENSPAIDIGIDLGYGTDAGYLQYTAQEADIEERKTKIFAPNGVPFAPNGILFLTE